jgi:hypothetical protein
MVGADESAIGDEVVDQTVEAGADFGTSAVPAVEARDSRREVVTGDPGAGPDQLRQRLRKLDVGNLLDSPGTAGHRGADDGAVAVDKAPESGPSLA